LGIAVFIQILFIILTIGLLISIHEVAHVIAAKLLGLSVKKIGIAYSPIPHPYVEVEFPRKIKARLIYLFAGAFTTQILFFINYVGDLGKVSHSRKSF